MENLLYLFLSAFFIYFVIRIATAKRTEEVKRAFAGAYDGKGANVTLTKDRNNIIFTENENVVDLSKYDKYLISGHSLEKVGLPDGAFVYAKPYVETEFDSICNHFVIFKYDNKRLEKEHPEITDLVDGYKARKVVTILENKLSQEQFKEKMKNILLKDDDIQDKEGCLKRLWSKYSFASNYYSEETELVVSITYKNGEIKDYSFHSKKFLRGVIKYKSVS